MLYKLGFNISFDGIEDASDKELRELAQASIADELGVVFTLDDVMLDRSMGSSVYVHAMLWLDDVAIREKVASSMSSKLSKNVTANGVFLEYK